MAENSENVNTSQNKASIFMIFPEKIVNQHIEARGGFRQVQKVRINLSNNSDF